MYKITLAALGQDVEQDELVYADRGKFSADKLAHNLTHRWAWNIRGIAGHEADGPAVFIVYEKHA